MAPYKAKGKATRHPGLKRLDENTWHVRLTWIDPNTGQRRNRQKIVTGDLLAAQKARAALREQEPSTGAPPRPRFKEFADAWLSKHKKNLEPSTLARYTADVGNLNVTFAGWWVDRITYEALEDWQSSMSRLVDVKDAKPPRQEPLYAAPTINGWHRTMRLILDVAMRKGLLAVNHARKLSTLPEGRTKGARGTSLTSAQLKAFIDAIPLCVGPELEPDPKTKRVPRRKKDDPEVIAPDVARGLYVYAWTGMRAGEIVALDWQHIIDGEFHVQHSVGRDGQKKSDKTDDPRRITVVEPLVAILEEQRHWLIKTQHEGLASGLVFPGNPQQVAAGAARRKNEGGAGEERWFRSQSTFQRAITIVCEKAKVPRVTPHALRRTFEDLTREAGVEQLVRRAIHGWRSERAQGIYATVRREERDEAARAVVKLVLGR